MTITAIRPVPSGDPERDARVHAAHVRDPQHRQVLADRLRGALALIDGIAAGLHLAAPDLGVDVSAGTDSHLFLARSGLADLARGFESGDLFQSTQVSADIEAYRYDRDLVDRTELMYAVSGSQLADRERAAFEAGRLAAECDLNGTD
jgi:hypothetical protein